MGAIILSVVIITVWTRTAYQNFGYLAGQAAPAEFTQLVVYKGPKRASGGIELTLQPWSTASSSVRSTVSSATTAARSAPREAADLADDAASLSRRAVSSCMLLTQCSSTLSCQATLLYTRPTMSASSCRTSWRSCLELSAHSVRRFLVYSIADTPSPRRPRGSSTLVGRR